MNILRWNTSLVTAILCGLMLNLNLSFTQSNVRFARQGYSMRLTYDNRGVAGKDALPDSVGLEYPIGSSYEHIYGAGLWIGGILDTSSGPTPVYIRGVSTAYEGWSGPLREFNPGASPADSIWKVEGRGVLRPPSWDAYWGDAIPRYSFSDNDHYCLYDDYRVPVYPNPPLRLKVAQSSFVWSASYAEAIHIMEFKILNMGIKQIDSAYVGMFMDADVGPPPVPNFGQHNYAGYYPDVRTAYVHNPVDFGSTPVGIRILHASLPLDSLRYAFRWWAGPSSPGTEALRYAILSSGIIQPDEFPGLSDTRCMLSFGPFTLRPPGIPPHDTLVVAVGIVSGQNLSALRLHAERARMIYLNGGIVAVDQPANGVPDHFELQQNYPNPFNPTTRIQFSLVTTEEVQLDVFDILGRKVQTLVNRQLPAGGHKVDWDGEGEHGEQLAGGVYLYRVTAGSFVSVKKMLMLK